MTISALKSVNKVTTLKPWHRASVVIQGATGSDAA
jgi:hypothetical protein